MTDTISQNSPHFTILLVDDREENLIALEEILEAENRVFLKASSGNEALMLALKNEDIGLIMLDVQMPEMDGFEVARLLKSNTRTREISIIFVTAINKEEQYILEGFKQGAVDYMQKPLDINITKAKVKVFEQLYFHQLNLKNTIAEKNKLNKQLERFMYIVAHDLKSPLCGLVGLIEIMNEHEEVNSTEELKEYTHLMKHASLHLVSMIDSILDYSRKSGIEQELEWVDTQALVEEIALLLFTPKHIRIEIENPLPKLFTKKIKLQQVFQNLMSNALKYNDKKEGRIAIGHTEEAEFYKFYIRDNGPGIAEQDQQRVFNLFQTASTVSNRDSSVGVGLNITKMFVEEQGGQITVESIAGEGSTFYFQWQKK